MLTERQRKIIANLPINYISAFWINAMTYDDDVAYAITVAQLIRDNRTEYLEIEPDE